jgi:hypothetical protein
VHPSKLFVGRALACLKLNTRDRVLVQVFLNCSQTPGMLRITPLEVQALQNMPDSFFHPAWNKRQIHLWIMAQHYFIKKYVYGSIT